jgi:hypothetical protein
LFKKDVAEFYYQVQITMGQGFKMIAENGGESIVQDCDDRIFGHATFGN